METKDRLLDAAARTFAKVGYQKATIAEICRLAEANIAAVNYHFGNKENLYIESWKTAFHAAITRYPPDGGVAAEAPVEERLRGQIRAIVLRILDRELIESDIIAMEMANPSGVLLRAIPETIDPFRLAMIANVRELLGPTVTPERLMGCTMSIMSQCMHLMVIRRMPREVFPKQLPPMPAPAYMAEHIAEFSLGALAAMRARYESAGEVES